MTLEIFITDAFEPEQAAAQLGMRTQSGHQGFHLPAGLAEPAPGVRAPCSFHNDLEGIEQLGLALARFDGANGQEGVARGIELREHRCGILGQALRRGPNSRCPHRGGNG
jgi:hypothetical protein